MIFSSVTWFILFCITSFASSHVSSHVSSHSHAVSQALIASFKVYIFSQICDIIYVDNI